MGSLNEVTLIGNVGKDPELKRGSGDPFLLFTLATSDKWKEKDTGEKRERTEWHNIVLFGKRAEALSPYIAKGSKLCVRGSIRYKSTESDDGTKRYFTNINARDIVLLGGNKPNAPKAAEPQQEYDDDIPF